MAIPIVIESSPETDAWTNETHVHLFIKIAFEFQKNFKMCRSLAAISNLTLKVANEWAFETILNLRKLQCMLRQLFRGSYCDRMWTFTMYYILKAEGLKGFK